MCAHTHTHRENVLKLWWEVQNEQVTVLFRLTFRMQKISINRDSYRRVEGL